MHICLSWKGGVALFLLELLPLSDSNARSRCFQRSTCALVLDVLQAYDRAAPYYGDPQSEHITKHGITV